MTIYHYLPFNPLWEYAGDPNARTPGAKNSMVPSPTSTFARRVGVSRRAVARWKRSGMIARYVAEQVCDSLGVHPVEVWGDDYFRI